MKKYIGFFAGICFTLRLFAQEISLPSNSLKETLSKTHPDLQYRYTEASRTHDYSNNWDFDGDGVKDELCWVGNDGAHKYYALLLRLSSDHRWRKYSFIQTDLPMLTATDTAGLNQSSFGFVVAATGTTRTPALFFRIDASTLMAFQTDLKKRQVYGQRIRLHFEKGEARWGKY